MARVRTLARWKKLAWNAFSRFIRQRDNGVCFTCGAKKNWKEMDAGHYIPGSICGLILFFSDKNVHTQCTYCNRFLHGNLTQYALRLKEKYGADILEWLDAERLRTKGTKFYKDDYERIIKDYE